MVGNDISCPWSTKRQKALEELAGTLGSALVINEAYGKTRRPLDGKFGCTGCQESQVILTQCGHSLPVRSHS